MHVFAVHGAKLANLVGMVEQGLDALQVITGLKPDRRDELIARTDLIISYAGNDFDFANRGRDAPQVRNREFRAQLAQRFLDGMEQFGFDKYLFMGPGRAWYWTGQD